LLAVACTAAGQQAGVGPASLSGTAARAGASAEELLAIVTTLAAPDMGGRATGSPGMERAARYIAREFERAGLTPGGDGRSYFQRFEVVTGIRLGEGNRLRLEQAGRGSAYQVGTDFMPFSFSDSGEVQGEVVFAGYGITAPELSYDDYAGLDAAGKIVLLMSGEPRERDPTSPFRKPEAYRYTEVRYKVLNAREHGAAAVLVVMSPATQGSEEEQLFAIRGVTSVAQSGILAVNVLRPVADAILAGTGRSLAELRAASDRELRPQSFPVPARSVDLAVHLIHEKGEGWNVVGILPGADPERLAESIIIGAHYDHLGLGGESSLAPSRYGEVHAGADDNASGVAGMIGLARVFAAAGGARRTLIFIAFAGEEMGLLGSTQYARSPALPLEGTVSMLNMDMIGRLRNDKLYIFGVDTGKEFRETLAAANRRAALDLAFSGDGYGPSDHTPFYGRGRPVLFFFTGPHEDYHRPTDTPDKINAPGLARVVALIGDVLRALADSMAPVTFVRAREAPPPRARGGGQSYGPYFGLIPEFGQPDDGVRLGGVRPGSPAEKAGLQAGDLIVRFDEKPVKNLEDLTFILRGKRAGDRVEVLFRRGNELRTTSAVLERRQ
jgi:membrane-associated protease RseP (regulator of RpoE activity)